MASNMLLPAMPYLSERALIGLKHYQYHSGGTTLLDDIHQPFWNCESRTTHSAKQAQDPASGRRCHRCWPYCLLTLRLLMLLKGSSPTFRCGWPRISSRCLALAACSWATSHLPTTYPSSKVTYLHGLTTAHVR